MEDIRKGGSTSSYRSAKDVHFEFEGHQIWDSMHEKTGYNNYRYSPKLFSSSDSFGAGAKAVTHPQSSAPMAIPDWQKIYGCGYSAKISSYGLQEEQESHGIFPSFGSQAGYGEYYDDDGEMIMPPHEYIAKKLASNQISSFSVFDGAGRTLKGRDLSRVRNAVLTETGFIE